MKWKEQTNQDFSCTACDVYTLFNIRSE